MPCRLGCLEVVLDFRPSLHGLGSPTLVREARVLHESRTYFLASTLPHSQIRFMSVVAGERKVSKKIAGHRKRDRKRDPLGLAANTSNDHVPGELHSKPSQRDFRGLEFSNVGV